MKRKYTEIEVEKLLKKYKDGNYGKVAFAKEEKISVNTLNLWLDKMEDNVTNELKFIKIIQPELLKKSSEVKIEFEGFQIIVDDDTSEAILLKVLKVVKAIC